jgi:hypothetical protein
MDKHHKGQDFKMSYQKLREYIEKSELRIVNDDLRVRLSPELAVKFDAGSTIFT